MLFVQRTISGQHTLNWSNLLEIVICAKSDFMNIVAMMLILENLQEHSHVLII